MPQDVALAEASVRSQHHLEEHVLRNQNPVPVSRIDEALNSGSVLFIAWTLGALPRAILVPADDPSLRGKHGQG